MPKHDILSILKHKHVLGKGKGNHTAIPFFFPVQVHGKNYFLKNSYFRLLAEAVAQKNNDQP